MVRIGFILAHFVAIAALAAASYLIGQRLTRPLRSPPTCERATLATMIGLAVIGYLIFGIGLAGGLGRPTLAATLSAAVVLCGLDRSRWIRWRQVLERWWRNDAARRLACAIVPALAALALTAPFWLLPLYPPISWDATSYHLAAAKTYAQQGRIVLTPNLRYAAQPQLNEMLFTAALLLSDDITAQLVQFLMMLLTAACLYGWGRELGSQRAAIWAPAILLGNPAVVRFAATAYIDIGLTAWTTFAARAFSLWLSRDGRGWLLVAAAFSACAAGSKHSGLLVLATFCLAAAFFGYRRRRTGDAVVAVLFALAVASPWYLRTYYCTGDPLSPALADRFPGFWTPADLASQAAEMRSYGAGRTLAALASLWWNLLFHPTLFHSDTRFSPIVVALLPLTLGLAIADKRWRGLAALLLSMVVCWFFTVQILRYLLPALPIWSLATALALDRAARWIVGERAGWIVGARRRGSLAFSAIGCMILVSPGWEYAWRQVKAAGAPPVTHAERTAYLSAHLPSYPAYALLNARRGRAYTLYALRDENMAYFADGIFMGDWFGPGRFARVIDHATDGKTLYRELRALGADHLLWNRAWHEAPRLPNDDFFRHHTRLLYQSPSVQLFELTHDDGEEAPSRPDWLDSSRCAGPRLPS